MLNFKIVFAAAGAVILSACATDGDMQAARAPVSDPVHTASLEDDDPGREICRTNRETGSFVRRTRTCMTASEWERHYAEASRDARDYQSGGACANRQGCN